MLCSIAASLLPAFVLQHCLACSCSNPGFRSNAAPNGGQALRTSRARAVGWDVQMQAPSWGQPHLAPHYLSADRFGCHAAAMR
jgi:hypothetical protein